MSDDHRRWKPCNRPLSPAEEMYLYLAVGPVVTPAQSWFRAIEAQRSVPLKTEAVEEEA